MTKNSVDVPARPNFKLLAIAEDECTKQFSCVVEFVTVYGDTRQIAMKRADFGIAKLVEETLKNSGAYFSPDPDMNDAAINTLIASSEAAEKWKYAARTGWRDGDQQYVTPYTTIGAGDPGIRIFPPCADQSESSRNKRGSLKKWQKQVAKPARHSSRMVLGICAAFSATLLKAAGLNTFGVLVFGRTKTAKSTALLAAASVTGFACEPDLPNFHATPAALAELPAKFNDSFLPLNELGLAEGSDRARYEMMCRFAYRLGEGSGKAYSKHFTQQPTLQWRTIALANSEEAAEELAQKAGVVRMEGEAIRWIDLPAVRKDRVTIFDLAPTKLFEGDEAAWSKKTCMKLRKAISKNHGVALCKFIEQAMSRRERITAELNALTQRFVEEVSRKSDSPQVGHLAGNFAHIYAGGVLAVELDILPWTKKLVLKCVKRCYFDARRAMRTPADLLRSGLRTLRQKLDGKTLIAVSKKKTSAKSFGAADGYIVTTGTDQKIIVRAEKFLGWFSDQRQARLVLKWLFDNGAITSTRKRGSGNDINWAKTQKTWPDGRRHHSIVLDLPLSVRNSLPK